MMPHLYPVVTFVIVVTGDCYLRYSRLILVLLNYLLTLPLYIVWFILPTLCCCSPDNTFTCRLLDVVPALTFPTPLLFYTVATAVDVTTFPHYVRLIYRYLVVTRTFTHLARSVPTVHAVVLTYIPTFGCSCPDPYPRYCPTLRCVGQLLIVGCCCYTGRHGLRYLRFALFIPTPITRRCLLHCPTPTALPHTYQRRYTVPRYRLYTPPHTTCSLRFTHFTT